MTLPDKIRRFDWRSAIIAAPFAILLAWIVTSLIDRAPPVVYEHVASLSSSVPQGGTIQLEFSVFRIRICDAQTRRWLTDSKGEKHSIPSFTVGPRLLAGLDTYRRSITVPEATALGQAFYQVEISYYCNPMHRLGWPIEVRSPPIRFDITPRPIIVLPPLFPSPERGE